MEAICPVCQKKLDPRKKGCGKIHCSYACRYKSRVLLIEVECMCGKKFICKRRKDGTPRKRFCSLQCVAQWRLSLPGAKEKCSAGGKHAVKKLLSWMKANREEFSKYHSERMKTNNPAQNPLIMEKMKATKRANGTLHVWKGIRGGNGFLTEPQKLLASALGWPMEVAVGTGPRKSGRATRYIIDIANSKLKIGIEVDGTGHRQKKIIELDRKKTEVLESLGWKILRFTNQEITMNLSLVLLRVKKEIRALPIFMTSK